MKNRRIDVNRSEATPVCKATEQAWKVSVKAIAKYRQIVQQLETAQQMLKAELMACSGGEK